MAYSVAYQHTDGYRNHDGSYKLHGIKKVGTDRNLLVPNSIMLPLFDYWFIIVERYCSRSLQQLLTGFHFVNHHGGFLGETGTSVPPVQSLSFD